MIVGRIDPVECIGVSQWRNGDVLNVKPPAMRVRDDLYKNSPFRYNRVVQATIKERKECADDVRQTSKPEI